MYGVTRNAEGFECYPVGQRDLFVILRQGCDMFRSVFKREIFASNREDDLGWGRGREKLEVKTQQK